MRRKMASNQWISVPRSKRNCTAQALAHAGRVTLAVSVILLASCTATLADLLNDEQQGEGTKQTYPVSGEVAWDIAMRVLHGYGSEAIEEHQKEGYMLTVVGGGYSGVYQSPRAMVGVWIHRDSPGPTEVKVLTRRTQSLRILTSLTESGFHKTFLKTLEKRNGK